MVVFVQHETFQDTRYVSLHWAAELSSRMAACTVFMNRQMSYMTASGWPRTLRDSWMHIHELCTWRLYAGFGIERCELVSMTVFVSGSVCILHSSEAFNCSRQPI